MSCQYHRPTRQVAPPVPPLLPCSLMHGLAMQFLRSDWQLENLAEHDESKLPAWVRRA